jgi:hypothetical protein
MQPQACAACLTVGASTSAIGDAAWLVRCWQQALGAGGVSVAGFAATQCGQVPAAATQARHRAGNGISMAIPAARASTQRAMRAGLNARFRMTLLSEVAELGQESSRPRAKREPEALTQRMSQEFADLHAAVAGEPLARGYFG